MEDIIPIKEKVLKYELKLFDEYTNKRELFIESVKNLNINQLSKTQLRNFICDVKMITDSLHTCEQNINLYFSNHDDSFNSNESLNSLKDIQSMVVLYNYINQLNN